VFRIPKIRLPNTLYSMRASLVRLIAWREIWDLLRDRRTIMIVLILPALIYPAFVAVGLVFAISVLEQKTVIGIVGSEYLPQPTTHPDALFGGSLMAGEYARRVDDPPLVIDGTFAPRYLKSEMQLGVLQVKPLDSEDNAPLRRREVDAVIVVPKDFQASIQANLKPQVRILGREGDETSKLAVKRVGSILSRWRDDVKAVRFAKQGLPPDFDTPMTIVDPDDHKPSDARAADELRDVLVKFLPFLLVMWTMAGALHPAIDLTAGEKERGTMETLLISPAKREEIVAGKFLAVFVFSYASSLWNLFWMAGGAILIGFLLPVKVLSLQGLGWAVLLAIPLAALFSSLALGLGVFARSTKEGQYYLLPLMMLTLPLCMYAMTPGLKLSPILSAVPITGLCLIMQNLLSVSGDTIPIICWVLGLGSMVGCMVLALCWASWQFRREGVLFRGEEGPSWRAWFRIMLNRD
jgi:sodium transport system permease protein